jgi:hypothetical protein
VLGAIDAATNQAYFHGHILGKSGVRPSSGLALTLHDAISADGKRQPRHEDDRLRLLHYDAASGEEFIRKWTALATAGPTRYRRSRAPMARALRTLAGKDVPDEVREKYLWRIYEITTRDDVELLGELGLLEDIDPEQGDSTPEALPEDAERELAARVEELSSWPKPPFFVADARADRARVANGQSTPRSGRAQRLKGLLRRS